MAEFQVVMKQAKRMCEAHEACYKCPLKNHSAMCAGNKNLSCIASKRDVSNLERIVMDWAAANPEPRYPTWAEWLRMLGVVMLSDIIPADIAKKLGIKPLGVKDDA